MLYGTLGTRVHQIIPLKVQTKDAATCVR